MKQFGLFLLSSVVFLTACNKDGCIDPTALNYDPKAEQDDGSCVYVVDNLNFKFYSKLGGQDFAFDTEVQSESGRMVKFTRAQMYLSGFSFNGTGGAYEVSDSHLLIKPDVEDYNIGYLPIDNYSSFAFSAGVDSISNHSDPASFPSSSALSVNNIDHMHWGWNSGYIFYVLEGLADTSAAMNGDVNAPFIFHVGTDKHLVDLAFVHDVNSIAEGVTVQMEVDWLKLLDGTNMVGDISSRSTHTSNNPALALLMAGNLEDAFSMH